VAERDDRRRHVAGCDDVRAMLSVPLIVDLQFVNSSIRQFANSPVHAVPNAIMLHPDE